MTHFPILLTYADQNINHPVVINSDSIVTPHEMSDLDKSIWASLLWMHANKMSMGEWIEYDKRDDYISSLWVSFYGDVAGFLSQTIRQPLAHISLHQDSGEASVSWRDASGITMVKDATHASYLMAQSPYLATYYKSKTVKSSRETGAHAIGALAQFCDTPYGHLMGLVMSAARHHYTGQYAGHNTSRLLALIGAMSAHQESLDAKTLDFRIVDMDFQGLLASSKLVHKTHWSKGNMVMSKTLMDFDILPIVAQTGRALCDLLVQEDPAILLFLFNYLCEGPAFPHTLSAHQEMRSMMVLNQAMSLINALPCPYEMTLPLI